jgi:hypothetical protein
MPEHLGTITTHALPTKLTCKIMSEKTDNSKNSSNQIEIQNFLVAGGTLSSTSTLLSNTWLPHL